MTPQDVRIEVDRRNRISWFKKIHDQKLFAQGQSVANQIIDEVLNMHATGKTLNVVELAKSQPSEAVNQQ
ncbi:hypothetical protein K504DRAFT_456868 [Pleomassaria siparia CBS 279.74]|uniref:Uncharacterized protein n=1 Tax=Pleomassaria siparia CBS 279.74 TaxID=1314801 RepID=A0A6G1KQ48_9PLEO|nr:hypothetical protein K504DRAFT_456868 [Pleomassaria siparia CBS 279.74]